MRTRKIKTIALLLSLAILATAIALLPSQSPPDPVTHGKHLTEWLNESVPGHFYLSEEAYAAIRGTGTNAVPALLRMVLYRDSRIKLAFIKLAARQHLIKFHFADADLVQQRGLQGFQALGPTGKVALPTLLRAFNAPAPIDVRSSIAVSLSYIGPDAREAIPTLLSALTSTNAPLRVNALWALGKIHENPELVIPALIKHLSDPDQYARQNACTGLAEFGSRATNAVPALQAAIDDKSRAMDGIAFDALRTIDPSAAASNDIKRAQNP